MNVHHVDFFLLRMDYVLHSHLYHIFLVKNCNLFILEMNRWKALFCGLYEFPNIFMPYFVTKYFLSYRSFSVLDLLLSSRLNFQFIHLFLRGLLQKIICFLFGDVMRFLCQVCSYYYSSNVSKWAVGAFSLSCSSFEILSASLFVQRNKSWNPVATFDLLSGSLDSST
jgi:hypothetical protein